MYRLSALAALSLAATSAVAQQAGDSTAESHPSMPIQICTAPGACETAADEVTLDSNWRWTHGVGGYTNCYTGNTWNDEFCPDGKTCAENCALEGADYQGTYGITTPSTGSLRLQFVTKGSNTNVGSRVYLMESEDKYRTFNLLNKEFTFTVDVSNLPCGLNGALYFSQMAADGGLAENSGNKAGAKYGTGYCDAQCPLDIKFINGEANSEGWVGSDSDPNGGAGKYGACCPEMDIWEANMDATAYTPHPCKSDGLARCEGADCGNGGDDRYQSICDKDGCDFNSFRLGNKDFYGPEKTIDTTKPVTVVTQFETVDGTDSGALKQINRFYVQGGKTIANSMAAVEGVDAVNHITDDFCKQQKTAFGDNDYFSELGGLGQMAKALSNMVLVMSIWDDHSASMNWLDSRFPVDADADKPGILRGRCDPEAGLPKNVESAHPDAAVVFSDIKFGAINSTFSA